MSPRDSGVSHCGAQISVEGLGVGGGRDLEKKEAGAFSDQHLIQGKSPKDRHPRPLSSPPKAWAKGYSGVSGVQCYAREEIPPLKLLLPDPSLIPRGLLSACTDQ